MRDARCVVIMADRAIFEVNEKDFSRAADNCCPAIWRYSWSGYCTFGLEVAVLDLELAKKLSFGVELAEGDMSLLVPVGLDCPEGAVG